MQRRTLQLVGSVGVALLLCLVFMTFFAGATAWAAAPTSAIQVEREASTRPVNSVIVDRRLISVPFGITSPMTLETDGQIYATGHAQCDEDMVAFRING